MEKPYVDKLIEQGYDLASAKEIEEYLGYLHNYNEEIWQGVKYARRDSRVGMVASYCDMIEFCLNGIKDQMLRQ